MKVFLDTNVLVKAFVARGLCADLVRYLLAEHEILIGDANIAELTCTLQEKLGAGVEQVKEVESQLRELTVVPDSDAGLPVHVRDPAHVVVLASAIAGEAEMLVTGDEDLLASADGSPVPIMSPRQTWDALRRSGFGTE